jgi:hypothetical protein
MTTALIVALALVVGLLAALVVGLLRSHADVLKALHDLGVNLEEEQPAERPRGNRRAISTSAHPPGRTAEGVAPPRGATPFAPATDLTGTLPTGGAARVAVAGVDHHTVLAFLSTGCGTCGIFWSALADLRPDDLPGAGTRLVVITNGPDSESPAAVAELAPAGVVTLMTSEAWDLYDVPVSPYFVLVDGPRARVVGEGAGTSWDQVLDLIGRSVADASPTVSSPPRPDLTRRSGQDRADWVDAELAKAGIEPGDPSLYPAPQPGPQPGTGGQR